jgi:hypothetical protein
MLFRERHIGYHLCTLIIYTIIYRMEICSCLSCDIASNEKITESTLNVRYVNLCSIFHFIHPCALGTARHAGSTGDDINHSASFTSHCLLTHPKSIDVIAAFDFTNSTIDSSRIRLTALSNATTALKLSTSHPTSTPPVNSHHRQYGRPTLITHARSTLTKYDIPSHPSLPNPPGLTPSQQCKSTTSPPPINPPTRTPPNPSPAASAKKKRPRATSACCFPRRKTRKRRVGISWGSIGSV